MTTGLLERVLVPANLPTFAFVLTRVTGMLLVGPLWSMQGLPRILRAALAFVLTLMLLPTVSRAEVPDQLLRIPVGLAMEFLLGLLIGLGAAVVVQGASMAGEVLTSQMGLNLGPSASPVSEVVIPGVGQLQSFLALLIYLSVNGHLMLLRGVGRSLEALPPGLNLVLAGGPGIGTRIFETLFSVALQVAAPALVALVLINLAVGITSRAVPQLNAIMVLFPVTIGVGLIMVGLTLPMVATTLEGWMGNIPGRITDTIDGFHAEPWGN